jgi:Cu2+-exporting ATPase
LLQSEHLERYYRLRGPTGRPVAVDRKHRDSKWLELEADRIASAPGLSRVELDVQGLHCSACVWLIEQLFARVSPPRLGGAAVGAVVVSPSVGRVVLTVGASFPLASFVERVEAFGYAVGPRGNDVASPARGLLFRFGVCTALSMNAMIFSVAIYAGLTSGPLHRLFERIDAALATAVVLIGGSVFFRAAWQGIKNRAVHLDLPIAVGIAFAYAGSVHGLLVGRPPYFDTLSVFVTLMLLGRFLQQRLLERNQRQLLQDAGARSLLTRRVENGAVRIVPCGDLSPGDELLIAPGDLVPVDAVLAPGSPDRAACSLDWINGESQPTSFASGETIPAGAFNAGFSPLRVRARTGLEQSGLTAILRTPARDTAARLKGTLSERLAPIYVATVLGLGLLSFGVWLAVSGDVSRALSVATATLVVTCPCAFGIATPLAYELALAGLRRRGLFVRSSGFLDKATRLRTVVFDKTGTLTDGTLEVARTVSSEDMTDADRAILAALASASAHPKSEAVRMHCAAGMTPLRLDAVEVPGQGVEAVCDGRRYRLGAVAWAAPGQRLDPAADLAFARDGVARMAMQTREKLRTDAAREVEALRARGLDVWILSGDAPSRVREVADAVGVLPSRAVGGCTASDKADWIRRHDRGDTLMIGDGINDLYAVATAFCSGTPAVDRPFVASRADFYFVSPGLAPIRAALVVSQGLARVVRRNLAVALAYNAVAVSLVLAGTMSPVICAVLMPLSSLSAIVTTTLALSEKGTLWRS